MWQNSIYHPTNYEITNSIFSTLTFNFMDEHMHLSDCHFNKIHNNKILKRMQTLLLFFMFVDNRVGLYTDYIPTGL